MDNEERNNFLKLDENVEMQSREQNARLAETEPLLEGNEDSCCGVEKLKMIISENIEGCDLLLCVFIAALNTYRVDRCLRPFPPQFIKNNEKDFVSLKTICDKIPPLADFLRLPPKNISKDILDLLTWLFIECGVPTLKPYKLGKLPLSVINKKVNINSLPEYVFEIKHSKKYELAWKNRIGTRDTFFVFHGSSVSNFFSILKFGLQPHFDLHKEVHYGSGIYLSNEVSVSTNFAPFKETWKHSRLGHRHSIIAVCNVINDKEDVRCKDEKDKSRATNEDSTGEIPANYFVVRNSELVKLQYLLVYKNHSSSAVKSFIKKHIIWIVIVLYVFMLAFIKFINGPSWRKFVRYLCSILE